MQARVLVAAFVVSLMGGSSAIWAQNSGVFNPLESFRKLLFGPASVQSSHGRMPEAGHKFRRSNRSRHTHHHSRGHSHDHYHHHHHHYHRHDPGEEAEAPPAEPERSSGAARRVSRDRKPTPVIPAPRFKPYGRIYSEPSSGRETEPLLPPPKRTTHQRPQVPEQVVEDTTLPPLAESASDTKNAQEDSQAPAKLDRLPQPARQLNSSAGSSRRRRGSSSSPGPPEPEATQAGSASSEVQAPSVGSSVQAASLDPKPASAQLDGDSGPLFLAVSPAVAIRCIGPSELVVGQPASYRMEVKNSGQVSARGVLIAVAVPAWVEVVKHETLVGQVRVIRQDNHQQVQWQIATLDPGAVCQLELQLQAQENRPVELRVQGSIQPLDSQVELTVKEAQLQLALEGPDAVEFGQRAVYRLVFSNPGTADAQDVKIRLLPIDSSDQPDEHTLGTIAAGGRKVVEVELVARRRGTVDIRVEATAQGNLKAVAHKRVRVLKAQLALAVQGPRVRYAGTEAVYRVQVTNQGDAPARNVRVRALLPSGLELVQSSHSGQWDAQKGELRWKLGRLGPGESMTLQARLKWTTEGRGIIRVVAQAQPDLSASARHSTQVIGLADLDLDLKAPRGVVPVGEETTYKVILTNQGTKAAEAVQMRVVVSPELELISLGGVGTKFEIHGHQAQATVDLVAPGKSRTVEIRTKALSPGSHVVRVEVFCPSLNIQLGEQKTTRFFADEDDPLGPQSSGQAPKLSTPLVPQPVPGPASDSSASSPQPTPVIPQPQFPPMPDPNSNSGD